MQESLTQLRSGLTRRAVLARLGLGSLGVALATRNLGAAAQEATPPVVADLPPAVQEVVAGWEALDADQIADAYAEDGIREDVPGGAVREGREVIRDYLTAYFGAFEDASAQIIMAFGTDTQATIEWMFSGSYTGQLLGFPPGEGQQVTVRGATVLDLVDGEVQHSRDYYDIYRILIQLGVMVAPAEATPPA